MRMKFLLLSVSMLAYAIGIVSELFSHFLNACTEGGTTLT